MKSFSKIVVLSSGLVLTATALQAQHPTPRRPLPPPSNFVGGSITLMDPVGEFGDFVDFGGGLGAFAVKSLGRSGRLGLRFDGSLLIYGHESFAAPFNDQISRVSVEVSTNNLIASLGVGPQVTLGDGPVRPYAYGTVGFSYFATESTVSDSFGGNEFASTTNFDDATFTLGGGLGMMFRISNGRKPVSIDLGVTFIDNGRTSYLRRGGIEDLPGGGVRVRPIASQTDLIQYRIGVTAAFR